MTTLSDETVRRQASLEARGTSGSTLKITSAALSLLFLAHQSGLGTSSASGKSIITDETVGTATAIVSLRITDQDLLAQLSRVYRVLSSEQVDLDVESSRILYQNLWSLY